MTKEQFIKHMTIIENYIFIRQNGGKVLNNTFFIGSIASVFDFGDDLINLIINQLSELSGIHRESIEWFLYESHGICKYYKSGFTMNIQTISDLWDFEQHEN